MGKEFDEFDEFDDLLDTGLYFFTGLDCLTEFLRFCRDCFDNNPTITWSYVDPYHIKQWAKVKGLKAYDFRNGFDYTISFRIKRR